MTLLPQQENDWFCLFKLQLINAKDILLLSRMQLCIPESFYTSKEAEIFIKHTLIRSTKSTISVIAVCNKMQSEPVFVADNWWWDIHSR